MNRDNVNRDKIAGFMLGLSVRVGMGLFLKPPEETGSRAAKQCTDSLTQHSDRGNRSGADRPEESERTFDRGATALTPAANPVFAVATDAFSKVANPPPELFDKHSDHPRLELASPGSLEGTQGQSG